MKAINFFDAKTQRRKGTQRILFIFFATSRLCVKWLCCVILLLLIGSQPVSAQTSAPQVSVTVSVLDADGQPVTGMRLELVIFQYAMSVEPLPAGGCETDETGSCVIWTDLSPSSGADWYEGVIYVSGLGRQLVGWQGNETFIVIQLTAEGILLTEEPHLHGPYTGEQYAPTDGSPTSSPTMTGTVTPTPSETTSPTETAIPTQTPTPTHLSSPDFAESAFPVAWMMVCVVVGVGMLWWGLAQRTKRHG